MKNFKKLSVFLLFIFIFSSLLKAQEGYYFTTHYKHNFDYLDYRIKAIAQDQKGVMYFAHRNGVMRFDGSEWEFIKVPHLVLDILVTDKQVFVAGKGGFGFIDQDFKNNKVYQVIAQDQLFDYKKIHLLNDRVYFQAEENIVEYDLATQKISFNWKAYSQRNVYDNSFVYDQKLYVEVSGKGIFVLEKEKINKISVGLPQGDEILFAQDFGTKSLIGSRKGQLYLFDGKNLDSLKLKDQAYIAESQLKDAKVLDNSRAVFATYRGGALLVNLINGTTEQFINYQTGLPDNEIFALGTDRQQGIWLAHEYGFSRVDYRLPIKKFAYHGLQGNVLAVTQHENTLYVATSEGVFYLDEVRNYQEVIQYIPKSSSKKADNERLAKSKNKKDSTQNDSKKLWERLFSKKDTKSGVEELEEKPEKKGFFKKLFGKKEKKDTEVKEEKPKPKQDTKTDEQQEKKGFFKRLFGKKEEKKTEPIQESPKNDSQPNTNEPNTNENSTTKKQAPRLSIDQKPNIVLEAHQVLALASVSHLFKKVEGISGKVKQLLATPDGLLAVGNMGIFNLKNKVATKIFAQPARFAYAKENLLWVIDTENRLVLLENDKSARTFDFFEDYISRISQDRNKDWWVCGTDSLHKISFSENSFSKTAFRIDNPQAEEILPLNYKNQFYFLISQKAYQVKEGMVFSDTTFGKDWKLFSQDEQMIWAFNGKTWKNFGKKNIENIGLLQYLNPISEIFWQNEQAFVWATNEKNEIYRIDLNAKIPSGSSYELILKDIDAENELAFHAESLVFDFDFGAVHFDFALPEFMNGKKVEYQYLLEGKMSQWSAWSNNGRVIFPTLEAGNYKLKVRSRDIFGRIQEAKTLEFSVKPPYWQTLWFMALEITFFLSLLGFTFYLNEKVSSRNPYFPWIRSGLTLLTLVLCMEFLEMLMQLVFDWHSDSPVQSFVVEVMIALCILPFERYLSKFLRRRQYKEERESQS